MCRMIRGRGGETKLRRARSGSSSTLSTLTRTRSVSALPQFVLCRCSPYDVPSAQMNASAVCSRRTRPPKTHMCTSTTDRTTSSWMGSLLLRNECVEGSWQRNYREATLIDLMACTLPWGESGGVDAYATCGTSKARGSCQLPAATAWRWCTHEKVQRLLGRHDYAATVRLPTSLQF